MLVMIDNYDSFTYNIVQYLGELGEEVRTFRNDEISVAEIAKLSPDRIMVSPGPGTPDSAGVSLEVIKYFAGKVPLMGVCLGHQSIGQAFGGKIVHAIDVMHGKTSMVEHNGSELFANIPSPYRVTRYHSLVVERKSLPAEFEVMAWTSDGEIMGLRHREMQLVGVQYHPESILTEHGHRLLQNFLEM